MNKRKEISKKNVDRKLRRNAITFQGRPTWSILEFSPNGVCQYCEFGPTGQNQYCESNGHWIPIYSSTDLIQVLEKLTGV